MNYEKIELGDGYYAVVLDTIDILDPNDEPEILGLPLNTDVNMLQRILQIKLDAYKNGIKVGRNEIRMNWERMLTVDWSDEDEGY